jgi:hypothetical protein
MKVYRNKVFATIGIIISSGFVLVGLSGLDPASHAGVQGIGIFVVLCSIGAWLAVMFATNRLVVSNEKIVYYYNTRKKVIPWECVVSFDVGISRTGPRWPCVVIHTGSGLMRLSGVAGTRAFADRVVRELQSFQADRGVTPS